MILAFLYLVFGCVGVGGKIMGWVVWRYIRFAAFVRVCV